MRAAFAIAALAGSAIAAPSYGAGYGNDHGKQDNKNVVVVVETVVKTVYVTEGYEVPSATPSVAHEAPAAPTTTVVYEEPAKPTYGSGYGYPVNSPVYEAPAPVKPTPTPEAPKPTPTPAPAPSPSPAPPTQGGYMGIVDEWRAKMGLKPLTYDAKLESNAMDVVVSSNGQMVHKLNPGTYGQVLAPGQPGDDNFTKVFVGGWLCEIPTLKGLDGVCAKMSEGWSYEGQTGHAEILTSDNYSKIACANHAGIWCCDLA
jgi:hypothetical protein